MNNFDVFESAASSSSQQQQSNRPIPAAVSSDLLAAATATVATSSPSVVATPKPLKGRSDYLRVLAFSCSMRNNISSLDASPLSQLPDPWKNVELKCPLRAFRTRQQYMIQLLQASLPFSSARNTATGFERHNTEAHNRYELLRLLLLLQHPYLRSPECCQRANVRGDYLTKELERRLECKKVDLLRRQSQVVTAEEEEAAPHAIDKLVLLESILRMQPVSNVLVVAKRAAVERLHHRSSTAGGSGEIPQQMNVGSGVIGDSYETIQTGASQRLADLHNTADAADDGDADRFRMILFAPRRQPIDHHSQSSATSSMMKFDTDPCVLWLPILMKIEYDLPPDAPGCAMSAEAFESKLRDRTSFRLPPNVSWLFRTKSSDVERTVVTAPPSLPLNLDTVVLVNVKLLGRPVGAPETVFVCAVSHCTTTKQFYLPLKEGSLVKVFQNRRSVHVGTVELIHDPFLCECACCLNLCWRAATTHPLANKGFSATVNTSKSSVAAGVMKFDAETHLNQWNSLATSSKSNINNDDDDNADTLATIVTQNRVTLGEFFSTLTSANHQIIIGLLPDDERPHVQEVLPLLEFKALQLLRGYQNERRKIYAKLSPPPRLPPATAAATAQPGVASPPSASANVDQSTSTPTTGSRDCFKHPFGRNHAYKMEKEIGVNWDEEASEKATSVSSSASLYNNRQSNGDDDEDENNDDDDGDDDSAATGDIAGATAMKKCPLSFFLGIDVSVKTSRKKSVGDYNVAGIIDLAERNAAIKWSRQLPLQGQDDLALYFLDFISVCIQFDLSEARVFYRPRFQDEDDADHGGANRKRVAKAIAANKWTGELCKRLSKVLDVQRVFLIDGDCVGESEVIMTRGGQAAGVKANSGSNRVRNGPNRKQTAAAPAATTSSSSSSSSTFVAGALVRGEGPHWICPPPAIDVVKKLAQGFFSQIVGPLIEQAFFVTRSAGKQHRCSEMIQHEYWFVFLETQGVAINDLVLSPLCDGSLAPLVREIATMKKKEKKKNSNNNNSRSNLSKGASSQSEASSAVATNKVTPAVASSDDGGSRKVLRTVLERHFKGRTRLDVNMPMNPDLFLHTELVGECIEACLEPAVTEQWGLVLANFASLGLNSPLGGSSMQFANGSAFPTPPTSNREKAKK